VRTKMHRKMMRRKFAKRVRAPENELDAAANVLRHLALEEGGSQHKEQMASDLEEIADKLKEHQ
jgi:hypothetical protein